ncbi:MAG: ribosomal protein S18-alanine N-acetyltransferase [Methylococcales bacterium]|nr:ribosomal protein S18-alanine N-acetyltransferase [Methylococcales bacterium]
MNLLNLLKNFVTYDADREFYAKVFPDSVKAVDLAQLRKMHKDDLPPILKIEAKNYQYPWSEAIFKDCFIATSYSCWVCENERQEIIGYAILSTGAGEAHIINISVDPLVQGQGIGQKMMQHLIAIARKKAETMFLEVRPSNLGAIKLYNSLGFNEVGRRKNYYPAESGREDAVILALELVSLF